MESTSCGISIADVSEPEMPLIYLNKAFTEMTGYSAEEVLGQNCRFLQDEDRDQEARHTIRKAIDTGESCTVILKNYTKEGKPFWNELIISPVHNEQGNLTHYVGIQNDVTEREDARMEVISQRDRLEELNEEKNRIMGIVAHDLRGPFASIMMCQSALAGDDLKPGERAEFSQMITDLSEKALRLIDNLLDTSAMESGLVRIEKNTVEMEPFLEKIIRLNQPAAHRKSISLQLHNEASGTWRFDALRVEQVLDNLLGNAFKFSHPDTTVTLAINQADDQLIFKVTDEGQGVSQADMKKLFKAFEKTDTAPTESEPGNGLGLSICKRIVEMHGGEIQVESELEKGSCFSFNLPA
jgi:PAS domain S-box-containing protein